MRTSERRDDVSRSTLLALLFCGDLGPDMPPPPDAHALEPLLAWSRARPDGRLDLRDAPLDPAQRAALPERLERLEASLPAWTRDGAWVIGRDDPFYPRRLRRRLGAASPPLLFGRGDPALLGRGGVFLVCGRDAANGGRVPALRDALAGSMLNLVQRHAAHHAISIARQAEPAATAELRLRPPAGLAAPDAGASATAGGDAAALDACCHGLADVVVVSGLDRNDDTWPTIAALIASGQQPVWVDGTDGDALLLIRMGARPVPPGLLADGGAAALLLPAPSAQAKRSRREPMPAGPTLSAPVPLHGFAETQAGFEGSSGAGGRDDPGAERFGRGAHLRLVQAGPPRLDRPMPAVTSTGARTLFELFQERLAVLLANGPLGAGRIAEAMDLTRQQVDAWLLRAEAHGAVQQDPQTRLYAAPER